MSLGDTFQTCPPILRMPVHRGRSEVAVVRPNRRERPLADVASALTDFCFFDPKRPRARRYSRWFCCDL